MRTFILLPALLPITIAAQATFAPIGAKWSYTQGVLFAPTPDSTLFMIECTGGTVIQSRTCSVLEQTAGWPTSMGFVQWVTTSGDTVLFWNELAQVFTPLYVFGLDPGSSWQTITPDPGWGESNTITSTVLSSGTVLIDGLAMRTSEVTAVASDQLGWFPYSSGTIIERLGDLGYMFPWMLGLDGDIVRGLRCYEDNEISWLSPHVLQCALGIGVEEHDGSEIVIRPSLAFQGELIQVLGAVGTLEVFDATGRLVRTYLTSGQLTFDLDRSGAYLLRLTSVRGELAIGRVLVL